MEAKGNLIIKLVLAVVIFGLLLLYYFYDPTSSPMFPRCFLRSTTGLHCPGCGSQRALHSILHGNIIEGLRKNMLIGLAFIVVIYEIYIVLTKMLFNAHPKNILQNKNTTIVILIIVVLFFILRNIPAFSFLAP
ncbi:MAG: DUF2752 domain-containing protein [bacterium]